MTAIELDDYARQAYTSFVEELDAIAAAEQRRDKAKQALIAFMAMNEVERATLDGVEVLSLANVQCVKFDVKRFEAAEPYKYREYLRGYSYARLSRLRSI